jgi:hypothetical protein
MVAITPERTPVRAQKTKRIIQPVSFLLTASRSMTSQKTKLMIRMISKIINNAPRPRIHPSRDMTILKRKKYIKIWSLN